MKREIRFRAWDIDNKRMFKNCFELTNEGTNTWVQFERESSSNIVWEQWTGLIDKNGKDIFEGDIVEYDEGTKAVVIFKNGMFMGYDGNASCSEEAELKLCPEETPFDGWDFELEIIGNLHQSPELLTNNN